MSGWVARRLEAGQPAWIMILSLFFFFYYAAVCSSMACPTLCIVWPLVDVELYDHPQGPLACSRIHPARLAVPSPPMYTCPMPTWMPIIRLLHPGRSKTSNPGHTPDSRSQSLTTQTLSLAPPVSHHPLRSMRFVSTPGLPLPSPTTCLTTYTPTCIHPFLGRLDVKSAVRKKGRYAWIWCADEAGLITRTPDVARLQGFAVRDRRDCAIRVPYPLASSYQLPHLKKDAGQHTNKSQTPHLPQRRNPRSPPRPDPRTRRRYLTDYLPSLSPPLYHLLVHLPTISKVSPTCAVQMAIPNITPDPDQSLTHPIPHPPPPVQVYY